MCENRYNDKILYICPNCVKKLGHAEWGLLTYRGFYNIYKTPEDLKCKKCGESLISTKLHCSEFDLLNKISHDSSFLMDMISLAENNPIEYQLKFSQFKTFINQQEIMKRSKEIENIPKCPTCSSTNIKKVSAVSKAGSVAMFGLFSQKVKKTWHCNKCGYEW